MSCDPSILRLYLVTDRRMRPDLPLPELVRQAAAGGVTCVQLREKDAEGAEFLRLGLEVAEALAGTGVPLFINDRIDVAAAVPCAGVHLGQKDLPIEVARRILGPDKIVGISVNTVAEALDAERRGADYLGAGPAFPTGTKLDTEPELGPEGLRRIVRGGAHPRRGHRRDQRSDHRPAGGSGPGRRGRGQRRLRRPRSPLRRRRPAQLIRAIV